MMDRQRSVAARVAVLVLALGLVAGACGSKSKTGTGSEANQAAPTDDVAEATPGGVLKVAVPAEIDGVNPVHNRWAMEGNMIGSAIFDTLLTFDEQRQLVPRLATSVEPNPEGTVWTITLRDDVVFHDGTPLDAEAVKMNIDGRREDPVTGGALASISETVVISPQVLEVHMNTPWYGYDYTLAAQGGYVTAPAQVNSGDDAARMAIGTGPFKMTEPFSPGEPIVLERNEEYWGDPAYLDGIEFSAIVDGAARAAALEAGTMDMIVTEDPGNIRKFRDTEGIVQVEDVASEEAFVMLNLENPPFDNMHARKAVAYATDTGSLIETLGEDVWVAADGPFTESERYAPDDAGYLAYDPEKAAEELAAYKADTGEDLAFTIKATEGSRADAAEALTGQWKEAGIDATVVQEEMTAYLVTMFFSDFEAIMFRNFGWVNPDSNYIFWHSSQAKGTGAGSINFGQLRSEEVDEILDTARVTSDDAVRTENFKALTPALNESLPYLWLWHVNWALAANADVGGLSTAQKLGFGRLDGKPWWNQIWLTT